jgi:hypothetical protein
MPGYAGALFDALRPYKSTSAQCLPGLGNSEVCCLDLRSRVKLQDRSARRPNSMCLWPSESEYTLLSLPEFDVLQ